MKSPLIVRATENLDRENFVISVVAGLILAVLSVSFFL